MKPIRIAQSHLPTAGDQGYSVVLDGVDIADTLQEVDVQISVGAVPRVTLHAVACPDIDLDTADVTILLDTIPEHVTPMLATPKVLRTVIHELSISESSARSLLREIARAMTS